MPRNATKTSVFTVSVPATIADQVERHRKAEHRTRSQVVSDALRIYLSRAEAIAKVDELLLEGVNSGPSIPVTPEWWAERRAKIAAKRHRPSKSKRS